MWSHISSVKLNGLPILRIDFTDRTVLVNRRLECLLLEDTSDIEMWCALCSMLNRLDEKPSITVPELSTLRSFVRAEIKQQQNHRRKFGTAHLFSSEEVVSLKSVYINLDIGENRIDKPSVDHILDQVIESSVFDLRVILRIDCSYADVGRLVWQALRRREYNDDISPSYLIEAGCSGCAFYYLRFGDSKTTVLLNVQDDSFESLLANGDTRVIPLIDTVRIGIEKAVGLISKLSLAYPHTPVKIRTFNGVATPTRTHLESIVQAARRAANASFLDCYLHKCFVSLSRMQPTLGPCSIPMIEEVAVDLSGNVFPCRGSFGTKPVGNVLEESLYAILRRNRDGGVRQEITGRNTRCAEKCVLSGVCRGCIVSNCEMALGLLEAAITPTIIQQTMKANSFS